MNKVVLDISLSDSDFDRLMVEIDLHLKRTGVKQTGRPLAAIVELSSRLNLNLPISAIPGPNGYYQPPVVKKVNEWYEKHYGDLLSYKNHLAEVVIAINFDLYRLIVPNAVGAFKLVCDKEFKPRKEFMLIKKGDAHPQLEINLLDNIQDLTRAQAQNIPDSEIPNIIQYAFRVYDLVFALDVLDAKYDNMLVDLKTSADNILHYHPDYGISKWHSLQFLEKLLKELILQSGKQHERTHNLARLCETLGVKIAPALLDQIQCAAAVRYDNRGITREDAWLAHQYVILIASQLIFRTQNKRSAVVY